MAVEWQRVLVTGAAGFLGRHLCRRLLRAGSARTVIALDVGAVREPAVDPRLRRITADVRDAAALAAAVAGVDVVFHLAAVADPRACERDPARARAVNVDGTAAVVRAAAGRRLVLLSSAAVYAGGAADPLDESAPVGDGGGVYAATKLAAERLCLDAASALDAIVVRNFNTYGAGQAPVFLVPELARRGLDEHHVSIATCRPVRDFTHVDDMVAALAALAASARGGEVYNVGSGTGVAVGDVALAVGRILGVPVSCGHAPVTGAERLVAVNAKLRAATGWRPAIELMDGLARTIEWFRRADALDDGSALDDG